MKKYIGTLLMIIIFGAAVIYFAFPGVLLSFAVWSERGSAGLSEKAVQVDDHNVVYLEGGNGETILLIHGYGGDKDNWTRFAKYLTPKYHVIALDLPGFGQSSRIPESSYDIESQVIRLNRFTEVIGLKEFHLAGNSMGGQIAGTYGAKYPRRVASVALLAPGGIISPQKSEFSRLLEKGINPLLVSGPEDYDRLLNFVFVKPPVIPGPIKKDFAEKAALHRPFNEKVMRDLINKPLSLEPFLGDIKAPVLIVWGDRDRVLDVSGAGAAEKKVNNVRKVIMTECGHLPMAERPEETASHYLAFLAK